MKSLRMSDVYAYIHAKLRGDEEIRRLIGLTATSTRLDEATKIQKKRKPKGIAKGRIPVISFYVNPGIREENAFVYGTTFDFDIYTSDEDEEVAINIADRINELFEGAYIGLKCVNSFKSEFLTMGEAETDHVDVYKFFTQIYFNLVIEG